MPAFKIAIVGDCYGEIEKQWGKSLIGPAGDELTRILTDAGLERGHCFITEVFRLQPVGNDIASLCCTKASGGGIPGRPAIATGKYVRSDYATELTRLYSELEQVRPNLVVLLGNVAAWALLGQTAVGKLRGAVTNSPYLPWAKCLPTYHPSAVLRQYELRHVTVADFMKAKLEAEFPEVKRVDREIWLDPTLEDIERFYEEYCINAVENSFDIETVGAEITCIGFAPSVDRALVIPFHDHRKPSGSYWETLEEELAAWNWVAKILDTEADKVAQNGIYDITHLWYTYGIPVRNFTKDTMIRHHSVQPELPKGLDFLGSVYTNNPAWKTERPRGKHSIKRED